MSTDILIDVDNVSRRFGHHDVLRDVSFTVVKGEVLGFLGPNGAGKTTTMRILTGTLAPSRGQVRVGGIDLLQHPTQAKAQLGYLPETPPLNRDLTVDEFLDFCARLRRVPRRQVRAAREQAKARTGLHDVGRRLIGNLSKGFQQRIGIAQAIIHNPPVVILDEPTVGLDPIQIQEIRALIRELGQAHSVILSTHILSEVQAICSHVQIIRRGELVLKSRIDELASHLQGAHLQVALRRPPPAEHLTRIDGVASLTPQGEGRWLVYFDANADPTDALVRAAAAGDWGLYELTRPRLSLEDVFLELAGDAPANAAEQAA
ncbi:MAG: ATP-binding cassette domain-containing protein [Immundisolibacter sp.]